MSLKSRFCAAAAVALLGLSVATPDADAFFRHRRNNCGGCGSYQNQCGYQGGYGWGGNVYQGHSGYYQGNAGYNQGYGGNCCGVQSGMNYNAPMQGQGASQTNDTAAPPPAEAPAPRNN